MNPAFMEWALDMQKKAWDESFKQWNRVLNAPTIAEHALHPEVAGTPHDVVYEKNSLKLYHYRRDSPAVVTEPLDRTGRPRLIRSSARLAPTRSPSTLVSVPM